MKKLTLYSLFISILSFNLQAQDLTQDQLREDFDFFNNALLEGHPGQYWYNPKQVFDKATQKVASGLSVTKNVNELHSALVNIVNTISCGHTAVFLPEEHYMEVDSINRFIPFNIVLVEDKVIVAESFTSSLSKGDQLLSINGQPIEKIISDLQQYIPVDKDIQTKRARSIEIIFPYSYAVFIGSPKVFEIEYKNSRGKKTKEEIPATGINEQMFKSARDFAPAQLPLELSIDDSKKFALLKLATFGPKSFKKSQINFQDTIKGIFTKLEDQSIENLIIDLRWNNGGNMRYAEYLFSFFIDSSNLFYKDAKIKQAVMEGVTKYGPSRNMKQMMEKQLGPLTPEDGFYYLSAEKFRVAPSTPQFTGKLYLITNGFSFSAASAFIAGIQQNNIGVIIGEVPGGAFDGVIAGPPITAVLPNSKIRLYYRTIGTRYNVTEGKTRVKVDVKIKNTVKGFVEERDEQLDYVKTIIKEPQKY